MRSLFFTLIVLVSELSFAETMNARVISGSTHQEGVSEWFCTVNISGETMSVNDVLQIIETQPAMAKELKSLFDVPKQAKLEDYIVEKALEQTKKDKKPVSKCMDATVRELFKNADAKNCTKLEEMAVKINKLSISKRGSFSDRCATAEKNTQKKKNLQ
jgi:hypothetical protein